MNDEEFEAALDRAVLFGRGRAAYKTVLRDIFAGIALHAFLTGDDWADPDVAACNAYTQADAMMEARKPDEPDASPS